MNKMIKILVIVIVTLLLTTTLHPAKKRGEAKEVHVSLLKASAILQKSYSHLFLLVNEISAGETIGQVDFLTAQDTIETIKCTLLDSRDFFSQAKDMTNTCSHSFPSVSRLCQKKIKQITEILEHIDSIGNSLKDEKVPTKELIHNLNGKYLECLRIDYVAGTHSLKR